MGRVRHDLPPMARRAYSRAEAMECGLKEWQLRDSRLAAPFHGIRVDQTTTAMLGADDRTKHPAQLWREKHALLAHIYAQVMLPHQFFSGLTAAVIWGLPAPINSAATQTLEVAVHAPSSAPMRAGLHGQQFRPRLIGRCRRGKLSTLDAPSIWAVLGPRLALHDRVALGDAIIREPRIGGNRGPTPRQPFATYDQLVSVASTKRRIGAQLLTDALPLIRQGSSSAPETHMRLLLEEAGVFIEDLDHDVYDETGRYLGTSECAITRFKVALEYEGDHHRTQVQQWNRDIEKYSDYEEAGWRVIRVTAELLYKRPKIFVEQVKRVLRSRGWQG